MAGCHQAKLVHRLEQATLRPLMRCQSWRLSEHVLSLVILGIKGKHALWTKGSCVLLWEEITHQGLLCSAIHVPLHRQILHGKVQLQALAKVNNCLTAKQCPCGRACVSRTWAKIAVAMFDLADAAYCECWYRIQGNPTMSCISL